MSVSRTVLITGATGTVSTALMNALEGADVDRRALVRDESTAEGPCEQATLDPRPGGACVQVHDGADRGGGLCHMHGTFLAVNPLWRMVFTWGFTHSTVVDPPPGSSVVEVTLAPLGSGTRLTLVHRDLRDGEIANHRGGWAEMLARLARIVFAARPQAARPARERGGA